MPRLFVFLCALGLLSGATALPAEPTAAAPGTLPAVALTFDDGLESHFKIALPLLKKYRLNATFFVVAKQIGTPGCMNWEQLSALQHDAMEIGNHSMTHAPLDAPSPELLKTEILDSKQLLESHGLTIRSIAFAHDRRPAEAIRLARDNGMTPRLYAIGTGPSDTEGRYRMWFSRFARPNSRVVLLIHGVSRESGGWSPIHDAERFEFLLAGLARLRDDGKITIGTFHDVAGQLPTSTATSGKETP